MNNRILTRQVPTNKDEMRGASTSRGRRHIAHLRQQCHNSKCVIFQERLLKRFWSAIIFYECNDDTTALQRRVLQTAL